MRAWWDFLSAVQFLTRIPVPSQAYREDSLTRSVKFFPVVGSLIGAAAATLYLLLAPHLPRLAVAALVVTFMVLLTGCFHEDGLADTADGFGGGWNRKQILEILRDSRIGSYGGAALVLSLTTRIALLSSFPLHNVLPVLVVAHVLCRWTTLPLSCFLPAARAESEGGQGIRVASLTTRDTLILGTLFSFGGAAVLLRWHAIAPILAAILITWLSGLYYRSRIGGVTGDCFGATNQLTEIGVYVCAAWVA